MSTHIYTQFRTQFRRVNTSTSFLSCLSRSPSISRWPPKTIVRRSYRDLLNSPKNHARCYFRDKAHGLYSSSYVNTTVKTTSRLIFSTSKNNFSSSSPTTMSEDTDENAALIQDYSIARRRGVRNVAIVAHVDHGKTTLVDKLLKAASQSIQLWKNSAHSNELSDPLLNMTLQNNDDLNRIMDSGELEKERGITITSKVTRLHYHSTKQDRNYIINVVDTPGHADFCGEVDRILSTVDGICLVVDAGEGPKAQTKYVLSRALSLGLRPIVCLNKVDRKEALLRLMTGETEGAVLDLFDALGAVNEQMNYRTVYASARGGWCTEDLDQALKVSNGEVSGEDAKATFGMNGLLEAILEDIPNPSVHSYDDLGNEYNNNNSGSDISTIHDKPSSISFDGESFGSQPFSMTATTVGYDPYLGRTCTGRIYSGGIGINKSVSVLRRNLESGHENQQGGTPTSVVTGIFVNRGVARTSLDPPMAYAGDIVTLAGVPESIQVGDTLTSAQNPVLHPIHTPPLAPPTLSCFFGANNGPLVGQEGTIVTSSKVRERLIAETDNNVTLTVTKCDTDAEKTVVFGRGELQIGILIEQMRREGYEFCVSPPIIVTKKCPETGKTLEPYEEVIVDVDSEYSGIVIDSLTGARKGSLIEMKDESDGKVRLVFDVPSRGLLGFGSEIATLTRGTAVLHHIFLEDREWAGSMEVNANKGRLVCNEMGKATLYALNSISDRGTLFVAPGDVVYPGMVIGENSKSGDLEINAVKAKQLTNIRTVSKDEKMYLPPPKRMTVEELIGYMADDEVIEVTPKSIRLRKSELDSGARERAARAKKKRLEAAKTSGKK